MHDRTYLCCAELIKLKLKTKKNKLYSDFRFSRVSKLLSTVVSWLKLTSSHISDNSVILIFGLMHHKKINHTPRVRLQGLHHNYCHECHLRIISIIPGFGIGLLGIMASCLFISCRSVKWLLFSLSPMICFLLINLFGDPSFAATAASTAVSRKRS